MKNTPEEMKMLAEKLAMSSVEASKLAGELVAAAVEASRLAGRLTTDTGRFTSGATKVLEKAIELLSKNMMAKGALARTRAGTAVDPWDKDAVAFSLSGSILGASRMLELSCADAMRIVGGVVPDNNLDEWNDKTERTYNEVLSVLKEASRRSR